MPNVKLLLKDYIKGLIIYVIILAITMGIGYYLQTATKTQITTTSAVSVLVVITFVILAPLGTARLTSKDPPVVIRK
jgi:hypothetical protein